MHAIIKDKRTRFKTFFGYGFSPAAESVNEWLDNNPDIMILDFKFTAYQGTHAICIMYEEVYTVNED